MRGTEKKATRVYSGFSVKPCSRTDETASFVSAVAKPAADGASANQRLDVDEVMSWTVESKTFAGRLFLRKSYKAEGNTGIYRVDALVTNTDPSECVLWNLVFKPDAGTSAKFIEESDEYKTLMVSLCVTWEDLGADFDE
jgi:hypothetical protein